MQAAKDGKIKSKWGSPREKMKKEEAMALTKWWHPDAKSAYDEFFKDSHEKWEKALAKAKEDNGDTLSDPKEPCQDPDQFEITEAGEEDIREEEKQSNDDDDEEEEAESGCDEDDLCC